MESIVIISMVFCAATVAAVLATVVLMSRRRQAVTEEALAREAAMAAEYERRLSAAVERMEARSREMQKESLLEINEASRRSFDRESESLRQANADSLAAILGPLKTELERFSKACADSYVNENATRRSLSDQIERLMQLNHTIGEEARSLSTALRHDTHRQGRWGEVVLETLLENAGLVRNINFITQAASDMSGAAYRNDEGRNLRPDVIILLPGERKMIVDSKVSLTAYIDYCDAENEAQAKAAMARHTESVRKHVRELFAAGYQGVVTGAAEHVLMFMPNEGAYLSAIENDRGLWNYAYERNVVIVSPAHLFSVMQLVSQMWRQENQNRNAEKISALGGLLYDKFVRFTEEMRKVERSLDDARRAYDASMRHLASGGTSLVARAERLRNLGAKTRQKLPDELRGEASDESSD